MSRGLDAQGKADGRGDQQRQDRQRQRHRQPLDDEIDDRSLVAERDAELATEHGVQPRDVLDRQRPVRAELVLELAERVARRVGAQDQLRWITRDDAQHDEGDDRDDQEGGDEARHLPREIPA